MVAKKIVIKNTQYKNNSLVKKINILAVANLTAPYWMQKNNPPLADAFILFAHFDKLIEKIDKYYLYNHPFNIGYIKTNIIFPTFTQFTSINRSILNNELRKFQQFLKIYTDGSKTNEGVGFAYSVPELNMLKKFKCSEHSSIFTAEALAILKALEYVANEPQLSSIIILSDSQSVLKALNNPTECKNPIIANILSYISLLHTEQFKELVFIWVKAHTGLTENETVENETLLQLDILSMELRFQIYVPLLKYRVYQAGQTSLNHMFLIQPIIIRQYIRFCRNSL